MTTPAQARADLLDLLRAVPGLEVTADPMPPAAVPGLAWARLDHVLAADVWCRGVMAQWTVLVATWGDLDQLLLDVVLALRGGDFDLTRVDVTSTDQGLPVLAATLTRDLTLQED